MKRNTRILAMTLCFALAACGGQESDTASTSDSGSAGATAAKASKDTAEAKMPEKAAKLPDVAAPAVDPSVTGCLDLVRQSQFADAVPVCIKAAGIDPENADVQAALSKAQSEAGLEGAQDAIKGLKAVGGEEAEGLGASAKGLGDRLQ